MIVKLGDGVILMEVFCYLQSKRETEREKETKREKNREIDREGKREIDRERE